jgi:hypothetical protein
LNSIELPLGEWLPDQADYKSPGLTEAENVYPLEGGYGPFQVASLSDKVVPAPVIGARQFFRNNGNQIVVGGTATRLFTLTNIVDVTNPPYATASSWRFERFNDLVIAVSPENDPQYLTDIDTSTFWVDLPGSPPKASCVGKVSDFLVLGDLEDYPNRVQWSAFNNPTLPWTTDPGQWSGFIDLDAKFGKVTGIVGGRWGLVFQQRAIWRMVFVGAPKAFDFELVADDKGCAAPDSIVTVGYQTFFMDRDGLYATNGSELESVGSGRVNKWLEDNVDPALRNQTHGTINWPKRCIVWAFKTPGRADYRRQLIYSWTTGRFTAADQSVDWLVQANQDALTLDDLASLYATTGEITETTGNPAWQAKDRLFAAFVRSGSTSVFAPFTGENARGYVTTGDFSVVPGRRAMVTGVAPIVERAESRIPCQILHRPRQGFSYSVRDEEFPGEDSYAPFNVDNWFHAFRMIFQRGTNWDKATSFWIRHRGTGKR